MDWFKIEGQYGSDSKRLMHGEISLKDKIIQGKIFDPYSQDPYQLVNGIYVLNDNNNSNIKIFKITDKHKMISRAYILEKNKGDSIEGEYNGRFVNLSFRIELRDNILYKIDPDRLMNELTSIDQVINLLNSHINSFEKNQVNFRIYNN